MKKIFASIAVLAAACFSMSAQQTDSFQSGLDSLFSVNPINGNVDIAIAGIKITLAPPTAAKKVSQAGKVDVDCFNLVELGSLITLNDGVSGRLAGQGQAFDFTGKSRAFSMDWVKVKVALSNSGSLSAYTGINSTWNNFFLDPDYVLVRDADNLPEAVAESGLKKSKFVASYLGVPVGLQINPARKLAIQAQYMPSVLCNTWTKTKSPKEKERFAGLEKISHSFEARVLYDDCGVFVRYTPTRIFKNEVGCSSNTLAIGLTINLD